MNAVLIDDDANVRENLKTLISIYVPHLQIVGEADGVKTGLECLKRWKPDLIFLDVEMTDGTGFDLLSIYGKPDFKLIFVTGHDGYAIRAFRYSAIDYLLKPVDPDDLVEAVSKAQETADRENDLRLSNLMANKRSSEPDQKIVLKDAESVYLVSVKEIIRCESETNYTRFFLVDGRVLLISRTLKEYDTLFQDQPFFRTHQSHLINLLHFDRYDKRDGGVAFMKNGSQVPVATRKKEQMMAALEKL